MKRTLFTALIAAALAAALTAPGAWAGEMATGKIDGRAAFEKLKGLAGEWSGSTPEGMAVPLIYRVTGNGSVVMETLFAGTEHEMINMYHLVGGELVATHYCSAGNQPSFKLDTEKSSPTELVFAFNGGTNFDPAKDGHVHNARIILAGDGKLNEEWAFWAGGAEKGVHKLNAARK
jgi:hypothetical protein